MTSEVLEKAQKSLNSGKSQLETAKELGISESSIRYHLRKGTLKKKRLTR
jgi:DNA-binding CsgD family transcriptional regulator